MVGSKKRFEYEFDDESDENAIGGASVRPQKLDWIDYALAILLGVAGAFFAWAVSYRGLHPVAWRDFAVASGLRPAETLTGGLWRFAASGVFAALGVGKGMAALTVAGKVALGLMTALVYVTFKEIVSILVRMIHGNWLWTRVLSRAVCVFAAVLFLCSEPVWSLGHAFTPVTLTALAFALSVCLLTRFLSGGSISTVYWAMFTIGLLCAETPLGPVWLFGFWMMFYILLTKGGLFHVKLLQPLVQQSSKWYLTFYWTVGLLLGIAVNIAAFKLFHGMEMADITTMGLPLRYGREIWGLLLGAATGGGWIVGIGFAFLPFVLAVGMLRRAVDVEYFLSYHIGIIFFATGCLTYSQMSSLQPIWFWTLFGKSIAVYSPLLLFLCAMMCAVTVLCAATVTLVDAFARDHRRLAAQYDPDLEEKGSGLTRRQVLVRFAVFTGVAALLLAGSVPGRVQPRTKAMLDIVNDYVSEVVTEAGDAKFLFSDGVFDPAVELESARRGGCLKCIATQCQTWIEKGFSVQISPLVRSGYSLASLMTDKEDVLSAGANGDTLLLSWKNDKPERLAESAVQNEDALKFWTEFDGGAYPPVSGAVASGMGRAATPESEAARLEGIARTDEIVDRMFALRDRGGSTAAAGYEVVDRYNSIMSRLSAMSRIRSRMAGATGDLDRAEFDTATAQKLDLMNPISRSLVDSLQFRSGSRRAGLMRPMTPRAGLHFALMRADYALAHRYAEYILDADEDDPDANFAAGMDYIQRGELLLSEKYLKRGLRRKPLEPAFWNNLAVVQHRLERYEEARANALKALELAPESIKIKDTIVKIDEAIKARDAGEEAPKTGIRVERPVGTEAIPEDGGRRRRTGSDAGRAADAR